MASNVKSASHSHGTRKEGKRPHIGNRSARGGYMASPFEISNDISELAAKFATVGSSNAAVSGVRRVIAEKTKVLQSQRGDGERAGIGAGTLSEKQRREQQLTSYTARQAEESKRESNNLTTSSNGKEQQQQKSKAAAKKEHDSDEEAEAVRSDNEGQENQEEEGSSDESPQNTEEPSEAPENAEEPEAEEVQEEDVIEEEVLPQVNIDERRMVGKERRRVQNLVTAKAHQRHDNGLVKRKRRNDDDDEDSDAERTLPFNQKPRTETPNTGKQNAQQKKVGAGGAASKIASPKNKMRGMDSARLAALAGGKRRR